MALGAPWHGCDSIKADQRKQAARTMSIICEMMTIVLRNDQTGSVYA